MSGFTVRPAKPGDLPILKNVVGAVYSEFGCSSEPDFNPVNYRDQGGEIWLLERSGAIFGMVGVRPSGNGEWVILGPFLSPAWRGLGMGRMLVDTVTDFCRANNNLPLVCLIGDDFQSQTEKLLACGFWQVDLPSGLSSAGECICLQIL